MFCNREQTAGRGCTVLGVATGWLMADLQDHVILLQLLSARRSGLRQGVIEQDTDDPTVRALFLHLAFPIRGP